VKPDLSDLTHTLSRITHLWHFFSAKTHQLRTPGAEHKELSLLCSLSVGVQGHCKDEWVFSLIQWKNLLAIYISCFIWRDNPAFKIKLVLVLTVYRRIKQSFAGWCRGHVHCVHFGRSYACLILCLKRSESCVYSPPWPCDNRASVEDELYRFPSTIIWFIPPHNLVQH